MGQKPIDTLYIPRKRPWFNVPLVYYAPVSPTATLAASDSFPLPPASSPISTQSQLPSSSPIAGQTIYSGFAILFSPFYSVFPAPSNLTLDLISAFAHSTSVLSTLTTHSISMISCLITTLTLSHFPKPGFLQPNTHPLN